MIEWKTIPDFSKYQVSQCGMIKSFVQYPEGKILKQVYTKDRYRQVGLLADSGVKKPRRVHRIVAITFIPNPHNLPEVNHIDGNKENNSVSNLEWCTPRHNQLHAYSTGLRTKMLGTTNPASKLSDADVIIIRKLINDGVSRKEILATYNLKSSMLYNIKLGKSWKHLL